MNVNTSPYFYSFIIKKLFILNTMGLHSKINWADVYHISGNEPKVVGYNGYDPWIGNAPLIQNHPIEFRYTQDGVFSILSQHSTNPKTMSKTIFVSQTSYSLVNINEIPKQIKNDIKNRFTFTRPLFPLNSQP